MGFLKKPDINDGIYLTYNMLHKPALLGILGAIAGMKGYEKNGVFPEYYKRLMHLDDDLKPIAGLFPIRVGIQPLPQKGEEKKFQGNYTKEIVSYNNSTGFASDEEGGNLIVTEQILLKPEYRCFLLLNLDNEDEKTLYDSIMSYKAEFLPYMGKNDFSAWWEEAKDYSTAKKFDFNRDYKIASIFFTKKKETVSGYIARSMSMFSAESKEITFLYFEKLPISFDEKLFQYFYDDFVYSNASFKAEMNMSEEGEFYQIDGNNIVQLF